MQPAGAPRLTIIAAVAPQMRRSFHSDLEIVPLAALPVDRLLEMVGRFEQEGERHLEDVGHLARHAARAAVSGGDHAEHRRDLVAGDGAIAVGDADHVDGGARQADLLLRLAQRGGDRAVVVGIDPAAGEGDLPGMLAQRGVAQRQQHARLGPVDDRARAPRRASAFARSQVGDRACRRRAGSVARARASLSARAQPFGQRHAAVLEARRRRRRSTAPAGVASSASASVGELVIDAARDERLEPGADVQIGVRAVARLVEAQRVVGPGDDHLAGVEAEGEAAVAAVALALQLDRDERRILDRDVELLGRA